jgi:hypothetical protein
MKTVSEPKTISKYESEAISDLNFDISKFQDYTTSIGSKKVKWGRYLYDEEKLLNTADHKLREAYLERYNHYRFNHETIIEPKNLDIYIKADVLYTEKETAVQLQKLKVNFIKEVLSTLEGQSFIVNSVLKHFLWEQGE